MGLTPCRDCGELLPDDAVGCTRCARNIEAERRVARSLGWALLVVVVFVVAIIAFTLRRSGT
jgi:hypothetical protein